MLVNRSFLLSIIIFFSSTEPLHAWHPFRTVAHFVKRAQNNVKATYFNLGVVEKDKLYRSGQLSAKELERVLNGTTFGVKIKTVINLRGASGESWYHDEKRLCKKYKVKLVDIHMSALSLSSKENLLKLLRAFKTASRPILIHCRGGADRTGEACALWKIEVQKQSKKMALKELSARYRHFKILYPTKDKLIAIWNGKKWLKRNYNPAAVA